MEPLDGQDVNMLNYFKDNNIPHTYQCAKCGAWMGKETESEQTKWCTHNWVVRDLRPFQKAEDENSHRNSGL